jgi:hypothetical protein
MSVLSPVTVLEEKDMQVSAGTLSLRSVPRAGAVMLLARADGQVEEFSCRVHLAGAHSCVNPKFQGAQSEVQWIWVTMAFGERYRFPLRIVIDGVVLRDRQFVIDALARNRSRVWFLLVPFTFTLLCVCIAILISSERKKNEPLST